MNGATLFGGLLFGTIGFSAFLYGKKQVSLKAMILGAILMVFPYFVSNPIALFGIGGLLTAALFFFHD